MRSLPFPRRLVRLLWLSLPCLSLAPAAFGSEDRTAEDRTVQAMCQAGLSESAIAYVTARRELARDDAGAQAKWTMRLMECHAFAALDARAAAEPHWQACEAIYQQFLTERPESPRTPWLAWQLTRCDLLQAQSELAKFLAAPANTQPRDAALSLVREMLAAVEQLEDDIQQRQPLASRSATADESRVPAEELRQLSVDAALLRCEALLVRARLYPSGSPDRIAAAADVDRQVAEVLQRSGPDWATRDQLVVAQLMSQLELGGSTAALQKLEEIARTSGNRTARIRAATVTVQHLAANGQLSRARALVSILESAEAGPELGLAEIELSLAEMGSQSGDSKQQALADLIEAAKQLGVRYGDYWQSRAEALLSGALRDNSLRDNSLRDNSLRDNSLPSTPATGDANLAYDVLIVEVRQLLAADDELAAIARLLKFRDDEAAVGQPALALKVASQAAALLQRREEWSSAADVLATSSLQLASSDAAPATHAQAIFCASQALRADVSQPELQKQYESLLKQQLATWPDAPASEEPQQWLRQWLTTQGRYSDLATIQLARSLASSQADIKQASLLDWLDAYVQIEDPAVRAQHLQDLAAALQSDSGVSELGAMVQAAAQSLTAWPTREVSSKQVRTLSEIDVGQRGPRFVALAPSIRLLHALRYPSDKTSKSEVVALVMAWDPSQLSPPTRESLARAIIAALDELPAGSQAAWAEQLKLTVSWPEWLSQSRSLLTRAAAYRIQVWSGDAVGGIQKFRELLEQAPRSGELQLQLAAALADAEQLDESTRLAKRLVANTPPASPMHWAARWRWLKNQVANNQQQAAEQAAALFLASQTVEDPVWRARFESLIR